jgi:hypothetical protein
MKNEHLAMMLLQLVKEHKEQCKQEDCGINTFMFYDLFKSLLDREATEEEFKVFI